MRVLVVEDEPDLLSVVAQSLREAGYAVDTAADGEDGLFKAQGGQYDALVLDLMLPQLDGWAVLKALRRAGNTVPVLILTARDALPDRVRGLDCGADDYLTKPFELAELFARLRAIIRRSAGKPSSMAQIGDVRIDTVRKCVSKGGPPGLISEQWWARFPRTVLQRVGQDEQDQLYFVIWGMRGEVLQASSPSLEVPPPEPEDNGQKTEDGAVRPLASSALRSPTSGVGGPEFRQRGLLREVILHGPFGVAVLVGKSMRSGEAALQQLRWKLLGAGIGVMAIGLCGGWLLSRRVTRPIRAISETARAISASDLSRRISVEEADSELGSLARTLNETFERLETAFARQVRFTADASHELRTPLSIIHSHAELALTRDRTAPEYKRAMETCLRAAQRTRSLVDALLVLARADAGKLDLKCERFDLKEAAEESLAMVTPRAQEHNVILETNLQPVELEADRTRVLQLLTNLLANGIQYNREGGRVTLTIGQEGSGSPTQNSALGSPSEAVLKVADTGVGIAAQDQPRVFERFFRADKARSREAGGSGLGLAICQSIVEAHHGAISFTSRPGAGTTFTVRLPPTRSPDARRPSGPGAGIVATTIQ